MDSFRPCFDAASDVCVLVASVAVLGVAASSSSSGVVLPLLLDDGPAPGANGAMQHARLRDPRLRVVFAAALMSDCPCAGGACEASDPSGEGARDGAREVEKVRARLAGVRAVGVVTTEGRRGREAPTPPGFGGDTRGTRGGRTRVGVGGRRTNGTGGIDVGVPANPLL
jgi:hypothetical protein